MNIDPVVLFGAAVWFAAWTATLAVIILRTKKVSTDVIASAGRIEGNAERHFKAMETRLDDKMKGLDLSSLGKQVDALGIKFTEVADNIPDFDQDALLARLDRLETGLPDMVGTHVSMAIKGVQATEGKAIAKYVEELGIEGITAEAQEAAVERLTVKQRLAYQLMTMKVPPKTKRDHPVSSLVFEQSRGLVAQQLIESDQRESGNVSYDNSGPARSGTFRPGYNP
jgi:hypothetical protein